MLFTPLDELGPRPGDRFRLVEYWCEVVIWLCQEYPVEYANGDVRTRWAIYHTMGLIADTAKDLEAETRIAMTRVNWKDLSGMRTFLVHRPWDVNPSTVWDSATEDIPMLLEDLRRVIAQRSE